MKPLLLAPALLLSTGAALANDFEPSMRGYVESEVLTWIADPVLVEAIRAQNRRHASLTPQDIDMMDQRWRAEVGQSVRPTIDGVVTGDAADFLRQRQMASAGVIAEVFVMDDHGLNVAASGATSDYWQGDEEKFTGSFGKPAGTMVVGDVEFDESTQSYQGQVSVPIHDPDTGAPIGAITIGLNAEMLF
ncbi:hypothetical protein [Pseudooceanicola sp. LIPI14-2-Ac024]|uniref:hypothetical protein n=1 Tax=Pseudooceanicola sp. LIPI14-2-Ac024 TaxID=3344875 RepID=UPI0035D03D13